MLEHIHKCSERNQELSWRLKELQIHESDVKNKLDSLTTENNNITMRLSQKAEQLERENSAMIHHIGSVPSRSPQKTRQDEIDELNEYDNVTQNSVNEYSRKVQSRITAHTNEINLEFERMQQRLMDHFKRFANTVRDRFEREVIKDGINQEFDKLSPIKRISTYDDEQNETGEDSHLSGVNGSDEESLNDEWLSPEMRLLKHNLIKAYTSPLKEYQSVINTTADFRKTSRVEKDLEHMDPIEKNKKKDRSVSIKQRRDNMKIRLENSKLRSSIGSNSGLNQEIIKSARLWNAFDTTDPYPDFKYTTNLVSPSVPQLSSSPQKSTRATLSRTKSVALYEQNNVRRKKNELVKTLLYSNRNR